LNVSHARVLVIGIKESWIRHVRTREDRAFKAMELNGALAGSMESK